jgi:hypothetical protein
MSGVGPVGERSIKDLESDYAAAKAKGTDFTTWLKGLQSGHLDNAGVAMGDKAKNIKWDPDPNKWADQIKAAGITLGPLATADLQKVCANYNFAKQMLSSANENLQSLEAMKKLLQSGDIEGAVMLLQTTRAKGLEQQLNNRLSALQDRNAQIKSLNDDMVRLQKEKNDLGKDDTTGRGNKDTDIAAKKGEIDKLNSDSQIDMIGIQGLVNKRNESFDMLTNLLGKFQKTIDGIVGNMR